MGSVDQRDHHLPVTTDTLLADAAAIAAAERVAEDIPVLVTPPLWPGHSLRHCSLGGTLTFELDAMVDVLDEVADAALDNGHGGNVAIVDNAVTLVGRAIDSPINALPETPRSLASTLLCRIWPSSLTSPEFRMKVSDSKCVIKFCDRRQ